MVYLAARDYRPEVPLDLADDIEKAQLAEAFGFTWEYVDSLSFVQLSVYLGYLEGLGKAREANSNADG